MSPIPPPFLIPKLIELTQHPIIVSHKTGLLSYPFNFFFIILIIFFYHIILENYHQFQKLKERNKILS